MMWRDPNEFRQRMLMEQQMQQMQQQAAQQPAPQGGGGIGGFLGGMVRGIVNPLAKSVNTQMALNRAPGEFVRAFTGLATGNEAAAQAAANRIKGMFNDQQGGLLNQGTSFNVQDAPVNALKKFAGNQAQVASTVLPVGKVGGVAKMATKGAGTGALYGGGEALAKPGSKLEDVLTGGLEGGVYGGAFGAAGGLLSKSASKVAGELPMAGAAERSRRALLGNAWGIKAGTKNAGDILTPQNATKLQSFVEKEMQVPRTANASMVFERAVNYADETGKAISSAISAANKPLQGKEVQGLAKAVENRFGKVAGVDYQANSSATQLLKQLSGVKSVDDLWQFRRALDERINFNRNSQTPDTIFEQFARGAREEIGNKLGQLAPEIKGLNKSYGRVQEVLDLVAPAAKAPRGVNLFNNRIGGAAFQRMQAAAGQTGGGALSRLTSLPPRGAQLGARAATIGALNAPKNDSLENALTGQSSLGMNPSTSTNSTMPTTSQNINSQYQQQQQESSPYGRENLMYDMARDPENADKYLSYYQTLQEIYPSQQQDPMADMSQSSRNALASSDNAINTVDQLQSLFANAGNGSGRIGGSIKGVAADIGFDQNAKVYNSLANASVTQIAKALAGSGAGTVSDMDAKVIMAALPTLRDTPEEAQKKFAALRQRLQTARNNTMTYGAGGGGSSLEEALMQQAAY